MNEELAEAGGAVTAGLIAREIDHARGDAPAVGHDVDEPCANCGTVRRGPYCHRCGQAGHVHRTAGALIHDIAHGVFHFEGRIWHTLPLLALRPGELTRRYVRGERARFVSPMALFLFSVFLMFAVMANLPGRFVETEPRQSAEARQRMATERRQLEAALAALEKQRAAARVPAAQAALDQQIGKRRRDLRMLAIPQIGLGEGGGKPLEVETGWPALDHAIAHASANPELTLYKLKSYGYKYSWALIPISLPFLWLLFAFRRDVGLYDHAIFATYSLAFMSLGVVALSVLGAIGLPGGLLLLLAVAIPPVHMYRQLQGAYGLTRLATAWRTVALLLIVSVTSLLYAALLFYLGSG